MVVHHNESSAKISLQYGLLIFGLVLMSSFSMQKISFGKVATHAMENIASVVGMSVGVPPNEVNTFASALETKEAQLTQREVALNERDQQVQQLIAEESAKQNRHTLVILLLVALFLVGLICTNFYLDFHRSQAIVPNNKAVGSDMNVHSGEFTTRL